MLHGLGWPARCLVCLSGVFTVSSPSLLEQAVPPEAAPPAFAAAFAGGGAGAFGGALAGLEDARPVPGALGVNTGFDWPLVEREEALQALAAGAPEDAAVPEPAGGGLALPGFRPPQRPWCVIMAVFMLRRWRSCLESGAVGTPRTFWSLDVICSQKLFTKSRLTLVYK